MEALCQKIYQEVYDLGSTEAVTRALPELAEKYCQTYEGTAEFIGTYLAALGNQMCKEIGTTGFQKSHTLFKFIFAFNFQHNKTGLKLVNYDDMLYPQYAYLFAPVISQTVWKNLQAQAEKLLQEHEGEYVHPDVRMHWQRIADGNVPHGYTVKGESE